MYLIRCNNCGKIYKSYDKVHTDYGDNIKKSCLKCKCKQLDTIEVEDWICDLIFKVKGS